MALPGGAFAQDAEPRRWTYLPTGLNVTGAAYIYSCYEAFYKPEPNLYFETAGLLIFFILLGKYLEANARHKTLLGHCPRRAIRRAALA